MRRRAEFLAANGGRRVAMPGFVLLVHPRGDGDPAIGMGFTVTKKIGNAVVRNRMKRRFRALARDLFPVDGIPGADHVLIGRSGATVRDHAGLLHDLRKALGKAKREPRAEGASSRPANGIDTPRPETAAVTSGNGDAGHGIGPRS